MHNLYRSLKNIEEKRILTILMVVFFLYFSFLTISQHYGLKTHMNDLGNMVQPFHNTLQGRFMQVSNYFISDDPETSRFAIHSNYIFILLLPVYYLLPYPETLLILQVFFVSLATLPLYLIGVGILKNKKLALIPPFLFLINPNVQDAVLYDFHAIVMLPVFLFAAFYFIETKNRIGLYLMLFIMIILKEDTALVSAMVGLYLVWKRKWLKDGAVIFVISLLYFILNVKFAMPFFAKGYDLAIISGRYSHLGNDYRQALFNMLQNPAWFVSQIISIDKLIYVLFLLLPFLYLPLYSWSLLVLSFPHFAINLLSSNPMTYYPFFYYHHVPIVAVLVLASVYAIKNLEASKKINFLIPVVVFAVAYSLTLSPAPYSLMHTYKDYAYTEHSLEIREIRHLIPVENSLSVQNNLGAHFAQREKVYTFPFNKNTADKILLDVNDPFSEPKMYPRFYNFIAYTQISPSLYEKEIVELFDDNNYFVSYYTESGYLLFERGDQEDVNGARQMFGKRIEILKNRYSDYEEYVYSNE